MANGVDVMAAMAQVGPPTLRQGSDGNHVSRLSLARGSLRRPRLDRLSQTAILLSRHPVERRRPRLRHRSSARARRKKIIAVGWATYPTLPTWTWPGQEGKPLQVEVYSGAERVRLYLNDKLIGEQPTGRDQEFKTTFSVPYTPGTLKAVGMRGDSAVAESILTTAGNATALRITADRTTIQANGQDLAFLTIEAVDAKGQPLLHAAQEVQFSISGPGLIAAVGNGDGEDEASYQADRRKLFHGRALVVVRTSRQTGPITVIARTPGLSDASETIQVTPAPEGAELR